MRPSVHQKLHVLRNAARNRIKGQEVVARALRIEIAEDLLQDIRRKGLELDELRLTSVKRLLAALEDLVHQAVDAAADHQIEPHLVVQEIPVALQLAERSGVNALEFLELVDDKRDFARLCESHHPPNDLRNALEPSRNVHAQLLRHLSRKQVAKLGLLASGDEEVQKPVGSVGLLDELCLPDPPSPGQHGETSRLPGFLPDTPQNGQLLLSIIELHRLLNP